MVYSDTLTTMILSYNVHNSYTLSLVAQVESNVSIREACMKEEHTFDVNGKNDIAGKPLFISY